MKKLDEKTWNVFNFTEVVDIKKGFYNKKPEEKGDGRIPFLGATDSNNGITRFLTLEAIKDSSKTGHGVNEPIERKLFKGGAIAVTNNGSVGHAYFQPAPFTCSHDVNPLYLLDHKLNENKALFLIKAIEKQGELFQYARKWRPKRMVKSKMLLPVDKDSCIDYEYMENYIETHRQRMLNQYKQYALDRVSELEYKKISEVSEKEWANFHIPEIFDENIQRGKRLTKANQNPGMIPYVSSTANNNGVDNYIEITKDSRVFSNCISLANSGSVGKAFYEPFEYVASDHVTSLKRKESSKYLYLFLTTVIEYQRSNFNFNREINDSRIQKMQIMLPVDEAGEPDYEYMEQYAKNMMLKKYKQYLDYLKNKA